MLVVADSSPLQYLVLIGHVDILPSLFENVAIPETVRDELTHASTPPQVKKFILNAPGWLVTHAVANVEPIAEIDPGECAAISLVRQLHADLLLIDDLDGRAAATQRGIAIVGTIGVLEAASARKLLDLTVAFARIRETPFRASDSLLAEALKRDQIRKQKDQSP